MTPLFLRRPISSVDEIRNRSIFEHRKSVGAILPSFRYGLILPRISREDVVEATSDDSATSLHRFVAIHFLTLSSHASQFHDLTHGRISFCLCLSLKGLSLASRLPGLPHGRNSFYRLLSLEGSPLADLLRDPPTRQNFVLRTYLP